MTLLISMVCHNIDHIQDKFEVILLVMKQKLVHELEPAKMHPHNPIVL